MKSIKVLWVCGDLPACHGRFDFINNQRATFGWEVALERLDNQNENIEDMITRLESADAVVADLTFEGTDGVPFLPVMAATLARFLLLKPTYLIAKESPNSDSAFPFDCIGLKNSIIFSSPADLSAKIQSPLLAKPLRNNRPVNGFPVFRNKKIFLALPFRFGFPGPPNLFDHLILNLKRAAASMVPQLTVLYLLAPLPTPVIQGILKEIQACRLFIGDFSTFPGSDIFPSANVVMEATLAKWVFLKPCLIVRQATVAARPGIWNQFNISTYHSADIETPVGRVSYGVWLKTSLSKNKLRPIAEYIRWFELQLHYRLGADIRKRFLVWLGLTAFLFICSWLILRSGEESNHVMAALTLVLLSGGLSALILMLKRFF